MTARPFLVRVPAFRGEPVRLIQTAAVSVLLRDKRTLEFRPQRGGPKDDQGHATISFVAADGTSSAHFGVHAGRTSKETHKAVRRIRPVDAEAIDSCDGWISALEDQIRAARELRAMAVADAWRRGEPIPVDDLTPRGDTGRLTLESSPTT